MTVRAWKALRAYSLAVTTSSAAKTVNSDGIIDLADTSRPQVGVPGRVRFVFSGSSCNYCAVAFSPTSATAVDGINVVPINQEVFMTLPPGTRSIAAIAPSGGSGTLSIELGHGG